MVLYSIAFVHVIIYYDGDLKLSYSIGMAKSKTVWLLC